MIGPVLLRNGGDHLLDYTALAEQVVREQQLGIVLDPLEHSRQNAVQGIALHDQQVLEQILTLVGALQLIDLVHVQTIEFQMDCLGEDLRLELPGVVCEHTDVGGQIAVDLHEAQGGKTVKPRVGHFLHDLLVALLLDVPDQRLPLALLGLRQKMAVYALGIRVTGILRSDSVYHGPLGDTLDQLAPCPDSVFFNGILIHNFLR